MTVEELLKENFLLGMEIKKLIKEYMVKTGKTPYIEIDNNGVNGTLHVSVTTHLTAAS